MKKIASYLLLAVVLFIISSVVLGVAGTIAAVAIELGIIYFPTLVCAAVPVLIGVSVFAVLWFNRNVPIDRKYEEKDLVTIIAAAFLVVIFAGSCYLRLRYYAESNPVSPTPTVTPTPNADNANSSESAPTTNTNSVKSPEKSKKGGKK